MRKIYFLLLLLPAMGWLSCKKESLSATVAPSATDETISAKIAPNETYTLTIPDAGNVSISRQAAHFLVSEASINAETGTPSFRYVPAANFTGKDEVTLVSSRVVSSYAAATGSSSCSSSGNSEGKISSSRFITVSISVGQ